MQNQEEYLLVQTICPDQALSIELARQIIEHKLAACVNVLPEVTSIYQWKGEVKQDSETLLLIKTTKSRYPALQKLITENHPYELPEVIAVPITEALPEFLSWIKETITEV